LANSAQARKRARQAIGRRARNMSARSSMRTAIKKLRTALGWRQRNSHSSIQRSHPGYW